MSKGSQGCVPGSNAAFSRVEVQWLVQEEQDTICCFFQRVCSSAVLRRNFRETEENSGGSGGDCPDEMRVTATSAGTWWAGQKWMDLRCILGEESGGTFDKCVCGVKGDKQMISL